MSALPKQTATDAARIGADPQPSALRRYLTISWVLTIVVFTLARVWAARETLQGKGLNIWVFAFIDLVTAVPYAIGVAKVVTALIDRRPGTASRWGAVAIASFFAPYLYIVWAGRDASFPPAVYVGLAVLVLIFGGNAIWKVVRQVRAARLAHAGSASVGARAASTASSAI